jgi:hypothetical protein
MEKVLCNVFSLWRKLFVKDLGKFLMEQALCKGISFMKRLIVKGVPYGKRSL